MRCAGGEGGVLPWSGRRAVSRAVRMAQRAGSSGAASSASCTSVERSRDGSALPGSTARRPGRGGRDGAGVRPDLGARDGGEGDVRPDLSTAAEAAAGTSVRAAGTDGRAAGTVFFPGTAVWIYTSEFLEQI